MRVGGRAARFFEEGCHEVVGSVHLQAGRAYRVELEFGKKPSDWLAAFRMGIGLPLGDKSIREQRCRWRAMPMWRSCASVR